MNDGADEDVAETTPAPSTTPAPAQAAAQSGEVTLKVAGPAWCTTMTFPQDDGSTLVIDRQGVAVPAEHAASLTETAARHGVTLAEVSN